MTLMGKRTNTQQFETHDNTKELHRQTQISPTVYRMYRNIEDCLRNNKHSTALHFESTWEAIRPICRPWTGQDVQSGQRSAAIQYHASAGKSQIEIKLSSYGSVIHKRTQPVPFVLHRTTVWTPKENLDTKELCHRMFASIPQNSHAAYVVDFRNNFTTDTRGHISWMRMSTTNCERVSISRFQFLLPAIPQGKSLQPISTNISSKTHDNRPAGLSSAKWHSKTTGTRNGTAPLEY